MFSKLRLSPITLNTLRSAPAITGTHQCNDHQTGLNRASSIPPPILLPEESLAGGKGRYPWTAEEDDLLIELQGQGMKWNDIAKSFDQYLYKRSPISCCLYHQNYLEKQASWDEEKQLKLVRIYERFINQMWQKKATETGVPSRLADSMHWQLGEKEMTACNDVPASLTTEHDCRTQSQQPTTPAPVSLAREPIVYQLSEAPALSSIAPSHSHSGSPANGFSVETQHLCTEWQRKLPDTHNQLQTLKRKAPKEPRINFLTKKRVELVPEDNNIIFRTPEKEAEYLDTEKCQPHCSRHCGLKTLNKYQKTHETRDKVSTYGLPHRQPPATFMNGRVLSSQTIVQPGPVTAPDDTFQSDEISKSAPLPPLGGPLLPTSAKDIASTKADSGKFINSELSHKTDVHRQVRRQYSQASEQSTSNSSSNFCCQKCGKAFDRQGDLTKHTKTHERPWKCSKEGCRYQERGSPYKAELERHQNDIHKTSTKMYKCSEANCTYESKRESKCKVHMQRIHNVNYVRSKAMNASSQFG